MTLFEIDDAIMECIDPETGEIDTERYDALQIERTKKLENVAMYQKECVAEAEAIGSEIKKLTERKRAAERRAESLKRYLVMALEGAKFKTPRVVISYRASKAIVIDDLDALPESFCRIQLSPDKEAIGKAIADGAEVPGARVEERSNMIIK